MKKIIALLLVMTMALSLAACADNTPAETTVNETTAPEETPAETTVPEETPAETTLPEETPAETTGAVSESGALTVLQNIFNAYAEDSRPPLAGGAGDTMSWEGPGVIATTDADNLSYYLLVPADQMANISEAASMMHAMNQNNMTVGAFKVTGDAKAFAETMANAVVNNTWMCGFPEKVAVYTIGEYVVMFYGKAGVDDPEFGNFLAPFVTAMTTAYPDATLVVEQNLM